MWLVDVHDARFERRQGSQQHGLLEEIEGEHAGWRWVFPKELDTSDHAVGYHSADTTHCIPS